MNAPPIKRRIWVIQRAAVVAGQAAAPLRRPFLLGLLALAACAGSLGLPVGEAAPQRNHD